MVAGNFENNCEQPRTLFLVLLLLVGYTLALQAQQKTGSLEGTVIDKNTRQPLELVNVLIEGTTIGAASDSKGYFSSQQHKLTLSGLFSRERMYASFDENPHYTGDFSWGSTNGVATARLLKSPSGFSGWLSYTYSVSTRKEGTNAALHYFDFDRPHLISMVANYRFAEDWQAGARFRYGSGKPYTPVASAFYNPDEGHWFPLPGEHNSSRFPDYSRLDIRVARHFQFDAFDLDVYLALLNSYNRKNPIHLMWDETYSSANPVTVFPFLPVLGVSAKF